MSEKSDRNKQTLFTDYYSKYYTEFYRYAYYFMGSAEDAEDAVAEALTVSYTKFDTLRDVEKFKFWFLRILCNICKTALKDRSRTVIPLYNENDEPMDIPDRTNSDMDDSAALRQLLDKLKPEDKSIVLMSVLGGYSGQEIAEALGLSHSNVRVRLCRALASMRQAINA